MSKKFSVYVLPSDAQKDLVTLKSNEDECGANGSYRHEEKNFEFFLKKIDQIRAWIF